MTFAELQASSLPAKVRPSFFVLTENSRKINGALVGGQALGIFATVRADFAFIGASGLDAEEGCSNKQLFEAEMTRAILP